MHKACPCLRAMDSSKPRPARASLSIGLVLLLVPFVFVATPAAAHGGHGPITYDELAVRFLLPAGESGEVDFEMSQGESVEWDVRTEDGRPVYVELHSHGFEFRRHVVENETTHTNGSFQAPLTGYYGILVEHKGADGADGANGTHETGKADGLEEDVLVDLRVEGWFSLLGLVNIEPLEDAPVEESGGPLVWWTLLGAGVLVVGGRRLGRP